MPEFFLFSRASTPGLTGFRTVPRPATQRAGLVVAADFYHRILQGFSGCGGAGSFRFSFPINKYNIYVFLLSETQYNSKNNNNSNKHRSFTHYSARSISIPGKTNKVEQSNDMYRMNMALSLSLSLSVSVCFRVFFFFSTTLSFHNDLMTARETGALRNGRSRGQWERGGNFRAANALRGLETRRSNGSSHFRR